MTCYTTDVELDMSDIENHNIEHVSDADSDIETSEVTINVIENGTEKNLPIVKYKIPAKRKIIHATNIENETERNGSIVKIERQSPSRLFRATNIENGTEKNRAIVKYESPPKLFRVERPPSPEEKCIICFDEFTTENPPYEIDVAEKISAYIHKVHAKQWHKDCILKWMKAKKSCPQCRYTLFVKVPLCKRIIKHMKRIAFIFTIFITEPVLYLGSIVMLWLITGVSRTKSRETSIDIAFTFLALAFLLTAVPHQFCDLRDKIAQCFGMEEEAEFVPIAVPINDENN